jgi:adenylate kinase
MKTSPLINYYKNQNKFFDVDGVGDINEISSRIFNTIDNDI